MDAGRAFLEARDFLIAHRDDYEAAYAGFRWPALDRFNWALDYFDVYARSNDRPALWVVDDEGGETKLSFAQLAERSNRIANYLRACGVRRGDRMLLMLPNMPPLWEIMLAAIKLGAVVSPASTLLSAADLLDRIERGEMRHVIADTPSSGRFAEVPGTYTRIVVGEDEIPGWLPFAAASEAPAAFEPDGPTGAGDPFLLYFTSGTTAKPKMVLHSHQSYPVGHLSTMYWVGLREGDVHLNISSPGWAKHAWSCFFAPWNAGATIFIHQLPRFDGQKTLAALVRHGVTTLCAPPTVWRMLILEDLKSYPVQLRELVSAGEPLNPEVIAQVREAWGLTVRDGYGQTETTCQIGNPPGEEVKVGGMGKPLPGYRIDLLDADGSAGDEGEISIRLDPRPLPLMEGYLDNPEASAKLLGGSHYRTSDVATRDAGGTFWYVGRADDVFKSSDYRISPFELESALIEHESVAEAAVVPSPDPIRLSVPKAYVVLKPGVKPSLAAAHALFRFSRQRLAPFARIRRIEFAELPKTISGKIRRVQLRAMEKERHALNVRGEHEYWEDDFIDLD
ncbi:MAG TPA: AMP-binding protein [Thermoanaerobaculia bacterium]|jgi:acetyl-CoA synthetase|nr:AMP-binding protein [Thermoanaerobaculia bacterium]